jgi:hypothetical protein
MQHQRRKTFHPAAFICDHPGCKKQCKSARGLKLHDEAVHASPTALLIHSEQPDLEPQHGEAPPSHSSPPASPQADFPNGSPPPNARRTSPQPIDNGLTIITHALLDGE